MNGLIVIASVIYSIIVIGISIRMSLNTKRSNVINVPPSKMPAPKAPPRQW
jgi:hypothetical protein